MFVPNSWRTRRFTHKRTRRPNRFHPRTEGLEDRCTPAATLYTVSSLVDAGAGTLRQAILDANANPGADTITFNFATPGDIQLTSGTLAISDSLVIQGPAGGLQTVRRSVNPKFSLFTLGSTTSGALPITVELSNLAMVNGQATGGLAGAVVNRANSTLTIEECQFTGNVGVISNYGTLAVLGSTLYENDGDSTADTVYTSGPATFVNSTFDSNIGNYGGAIHAETAADPLIIVNCTITDNHANKSNKASGGLTLENPAGATVVHSTILAGNTAGNQNTPTDAYGTVSGTSSHNWVGFDGAASGFSIALNAHLNAGDPQLEPLASYGGVTLTRHPMNYSPLSVVSPVIDAGDSSLVPVGITTDQRGVGFGRVVGAAVDIGAVEFPFVNDAPVAVIGGPYSGDEGSAIPLDGSGSYDPNAPADTIVRYEWDLDYDNGVDEWVEVTDPMYAVTFPDNFGPRTIALRVTDSHGATNIDTTTLTVYNEAPPVVMAPDPTMDEGSRITLDVATFTDPGTADTHTATIRWGDGSDAEDVIVTEPFNGSPGTVPGSHVYPDNGTYTVTVTVTDDDGGYDTETMTVTVENVAPTVSTVPDQHISEGETVSLTSVPVIFTDPGFGPTETFVAMIDWGDGSPTEPVSITVTPGGELTPTLGALSATHVFADNRAGGLPYHATISVRDDDMTDPDWWVESFFDIYVENLPPTSVDDVATVAEDASVTIPVLTNDTDPAGLLDPLHVVSATDGAHGSVVVNPDGTLTYTPAPDYNGPDGFTYTVGDDDGGTALASVSVTVTPVNDAPVVLDQNFTVPEFSLEGTPVGVMLASDVDGDSLGYAIVGGNEEGAFVIDPATGLLSVQYPAALDLDVHPTFTLTIRVTDDGTPVLSSTATALITLTPVGSPISIIDGNIVIRGGSGNDRLIVAGTNPNNMIVTLNNVNLPNPAGGPLVLDAKHRLIAFLKSGSDVVQITGAINTEIHGGLGNDMLYGGSGMDYLEGGGGDDYLSGAAGNDILIGWAGRDSLMGGTGDDLMIGGLVAPTWKYADLCLMLSQWSLSGTVPTLVPGVDVFDGDTASEADYLSGSGGKDVFVYRTTYDPLVSVLNRDRAADLGSLDAALTL